MAAFGAALGERAVGVLGPSQNSATLRIELGMRQYQSRFWRLDIDGQLLLASRPCYRGLNLSEIDRALVPQTLCPASDDIKYEDANRAGYQGLDVGPREEV